MKFGINATLHICNLQKMNMCVVSQSFLIVSHFFRLDKHTSLLLCSTGPRQISQNVSPWKVFLTQPKMCGYSQELTLKGSTFNIRQGCKSKNIFSVTTLHQNIQLRQNSQSRTSTLTQLHEDCTIKHSIIIMQ